MLVATVGHPVRCIVCGGERKCRRTEIPASLARDGAGRTVVGASQRRATTAKAWKTDDALAEICARCRHGDPEKVTQALLLHGDDAFTTVEIA